MMDVIDNLRIKLNHISKSLWGTIPQEIAVILTTMKIVILETIYETILSKISFGGEWLKNSVRVMP